MNTGWWGGNSKLVIFKHIWRIDIFSFSLWNCLQVNATRPHWWLVNIGSGNGLVPSGTKPLPELMFDSDLYRHMASAGHNELTCPRTNYTYSASCTIHSINAYISCRFILAHSAGYQLTLNRLYCFKDAFTFCIMPWIVFNRRPNSQRGKSTCCLFYTLNTKTADALAT